MEVLRVSDHMKSPGFRFVADGPNSGEEFRDKLLAPALRAAVARGSQLTVVLDGVSGYGSSFLEEAFGGLIRKRLFSSAEVTEHLVVEAGSPLFRPYKVLADQFIENSKPDREPAVA